MTDIEEKPTEAQEEKPKKASHLRKHGGNYAKLIAAISALTAAINGYLDLAKKNELVYQALASKVNHMSTELAEVRGQNEVLMMFVKAKLGAESDEFEAMEEAAVEEAPPVSSLGVAAGATPEADVAVTAVADEEPPAAALAKPPKAEKRVAVQAYQQLPDDLADLVQVQEQLKAAK